MKLSCVSVRDTLSAPPHTAAASIFFFCPSPEMKKWCVSSLAGVPAESFFKSKDCFAHPARVTARKMTKIDFMIYPKVTIGEW